MPVISVGAFRFVKHMDDAWSRRDINDTLISDTLRFLARGIAYFVNVDPSNTPFGASPTERFALRDRLQLTPNIFYFDAFVVEDIRPSNAEPSVARVAIAYFYREKTTNQRLDGRYRLIVVVDGNQIAHVEELHDSRYIEAFARLIKSTTHAADPSE